MPMLGTFALLLGASPQWACAAIAYVQGNYTSPFTTISSIAATYTSAQTAGDLNVVIISWEASAGTVSSVTDTLGNIYSVAVGPTADSGIASQTIYYAKNIASAAANANTVTITFAAAVPHPDLRIAEYSGIATATPLDVAVGNTATSASMTSGSATTTNASDLIVGASVVAHSTTGAGAGFTERLLTSHDDIFEDEVVSATGSYSATAPQDSSGWYIMQMAAFKAATGGGDTTPPTAPTGLSATPASASQINLTWTASTDNVGVTGYRVERCQGASCTSFAQIASPTATSYNDTGLSASTSYSYRVRATDAAGNLSTYSSTATASTSATGSGPVAWWKFNEGSGTTTADSSGNGFTGTLVSTTWTTGEIGNALSFNGTTAYVSAAGTGALANLYTAGMTVSAWIKPTNGGAGGAGRIVDKDNNGNGGWIFEMNSATGVKFASDQFATSQPSRASTATIASNTWQLVTATWDGSTNGANIHIYINGALADSTSANGSGAAEDDSTTPITIGNRQADAARGFAGVIDEVRIYNRILSSTEIAALYDTSAPTAPSGLSATAASSSQINLSWTASTDNVGVTGYLIERCQGSGCSTFAQIASIGGTTYSDSGLTGSTSYSYRVRATDAAGNLSSYSSTSSATTSAGGGGDTTPPTAPTGLSASAVSSTQMSLTWTASTDNVGVTGYLLERCQGTSCSTFSQIAAPATTSYADIGLAASTSYSYRARATDAAGNLSSYSSTASATTSASADTSPPTAPTGLSLTVVSSTQINLAWTASTDNVGVTGYRVERCSGVSCTTFAQIGTPASASFSDTGLSSATTYNYRVRATDTAGNLSGYSGSASASTSSGSSTYTYDPTTGRLKSIAVGSSTYYYHYDAAGHLISVNTTP